MEKVFKLKLSELTELCSIFSECDIDEKQFERLKNKELEIKKKANAFAQKLRKKQLVFEEKIRKSNQSLKIKI